MTEKVRGGEDDGYFYGSETNTVSIIPRDHFNTYSGEENGYFMPINMK